MNMMEAFLDGVSLVTIAKTVFAFAPLILPAAAGGPTDYRIARSLRFRQGNSGYLSRTPAGAGNRKTWTYSCWAKRGGTGFTLLSGRTDDSNRFHFVISGDQLYVQSTVAGASVGTLLSTAFYRDYSAWMHIVLAIDTTQATAANRAKLYVNGAEIAVTANYPAQNTDFFYNLASLTSIGRVEYSTPASYSDMYLADVHFIDGQALTPSSFGAADAVTGVWNPKTYAGTYGTNGFKLDFSDNSAATAGAIGADRSGNGNNWTPTNISVTAGVTNDSFVDTPTNYGTDTGVGGEVRGNYCTLNPLDNAGALTLSEGNLKATGLAGATWKSVRGTQFNSTFLEYWEAIVTTLGTEDEVMVGWANNSAALTGAPSTGTNVVNFVLATTVINKRTNGTNAALTSSGNLAVNDVLMFARDAITGNAWMGRNGTWFDAGSGTGNPATAANPTFTGMTGDFAPFVSCFDAGKVVVFNAGQRPFAYTAPSGYKALCTQNLPDPAIKKPSQYMDVHLRTGTGATGSVTGKGFQPDLLWTKGRSSAVDSAVNDSGRGVGAVLRTNTTGAETTGSPSNDGITSFNSDGFSFGANANSGTGNVNVNAVTYVYWMWKEGATPGFSRVTYTGNGAVRTIAHSLGVAPDLIIVKSRSAVSNWFVWHRSVTSGNGKYLYLDLTNVLSGPAGTPVWDSNDTTTQSSSSVFSIGANTGVNTNAATYVAYLFAGVPGFSKFGSYTGNGSADGPFVNCGFRPRWIMMKMTSSTGGWFLFDAARSDYNVADDYLQANTASVEGTFASVDFLSNGFKLKAAASDPNTSAATYIYAAFAENPFKYARAR